MACALPEAEGQKVTLADEFRTARADARRRRLAIGVGLCGGLIAFVVVGLTGSGTAGVGRGHIVGYAAPNPIASLFQGLFGRPIRSAGAPVVTMPITGGGRANAHIQRPRRIAVNRNAERAPREQPAPREGNRLVCVRLCDGYFFPAPLHARGSGDAACASLCPGSPTRLYSMRGDHVMNAVAVGDRTAYAKLPVALQYTKKTEATCSCGPVDPWDVIGADPTLRKGDRFMTATGFVIFEGRSGGSVDFTPLPRASGVAPQERQLLTAMERASGVSRRRVSAQSPAGNMATASTPTVTTR